MKLLLETSSDLAVKKQELERTQTEKKRLLETVEEQNQLLYSELDRKSTSIDISFRQRDGNWFPS